MNPSFHSRRHFIATLSGALAASAAAQEAQLSYKGENMRFGLVTYQWGNDWDIPTLIENMTKAGINGVELRVDHAHGVNPTLTAEQRSAVRNEFADAGIEVIGMGCNWMFHWPDAEELKTHLASAKDYIKLSHDVGGSGVKVKPDKLPKEVPVEKTLEQIANSLAELGDYATGFGQEIRLEVHGDVTDLGHIAKIMKMADRDNVRVCWNSNNKDLEGEGLEANFAKVQDYLGATTHVRELDTPGYPWDKLASLLVNVDYTGWVCLEGHKPPQGDRLPGLTKQRELWTGFVNAARASAK